MPAMRPLEGANPTPRVQLWLRARSSKLQGERRSRGGFGSSACEVWCLGAGPSGTPQPETGRAGHTTADLNDLSRL